MIWLHWKQKIFWRLLTECFFQASTSIDSKFLLLGKGMKARNGCSYAIASVWDLKGNNTMKKPREKRRKPFCVFEEANAPLLKCLHDTQTLCLLNILMLPSSITWSKERREKKFNAFFSFSRVLPIISDLCCCFPSRISPHSLLCKTL